MTLALLILVVLVLLEDIQDANAHRGFLKGWWYGENRWKAKYKDPSGPYSWRDQKWWARIGFGAFIDLWHLAKTVRTVLVCLLLASWAGLPLWWGAGFWVLYGGLHDHVFYGRMFR